MNMNINKNELITRLAAMAEMTKKDSETFLRAFIDAVTEALVQGDKVKISDLGTFEVRERSARTARNPRTGETVEVPASKAPSFKPGKTLKDAVNGR